MNPGRFSPTAGRVRDAWEEGLQRLIDERIRLERAARQQAHRVVTDEEERALSAFLGDLVGQLCDSEGKFRQSLARWGEPGVRIVEESREKLLAAVARRVRQAVAEEKMTAFDGGNDRSKRDGRQGGHKVAWMVAVGAAVIGSIVAYLLAEFNPIRRLYPVPAVTPHVDETRLQVLPGSQALTLERSPAPTSTPCYERRRIERTTDVIVGYGDWEDVGPDGLGGNVLKYTFTPPSGTIRSVSLKACPGCGNWLWTCPDPRCPDRQPTQRVNETTWVAWAATDGASPATPTYEMVYVVEETAEVPCG